jgi:hypothetical protein
VHFRVGIVSVFSAVETSLCFCLLVSFLPHWGIQHKPKRQDAVFGPLLITSTLVNLVIGIVFIVSDFVVTVFPKGTAKVVGVSLRTGPPSSQLSTTRELERGIAPQFLSRKTAVSPVQVAGTMVPDDADGFGKEGANDDMTPETRENGPTATTSFLHFTPLSHFYSTFCLENKKKQLRVASRTRVSAVSKLDSI